MAIGMASDNELDVGVDETAPRSDIITGLGKGAKDDALQMILARMSRIEEVLARLIIAMKQVVTPPPLLRY